MRQGVEVEMQMEDNMDIKMMGVKEKMTHRSRIQKEWSQGLPSGW